VIEVSWSSRKLEKSCSDDRAGNKAWGTEQWKVLRMRLASLRAASTLADMDGVPGRCHPLTADRAGQFAMDLRGPYRLTFVPAHDPVPRLDDGGIDKDKVTRVMIEGVENYHGD
jgi:proteic killer suppression protein